MTFNEYSIRAHATAVYPTHRTEYPILGLAGEVGELCNKIKKMYRDGLSLTQIQEDLVKEAGDCLWYLNEVCLVFGTSLPHVAEMNLQKLESRKERNTLHGEGDNR